MGLTTSSRIAVTATVILTVAHLAMQEAANFGISLSGHFADQLGAKNLKINPVAPELSLDSLDLNADSGLGNFSPNLGAESLPSRTITTNEPYRSQAELERATHVRHGLPENFGDPSYWNSPRQK